MFVCPERVKKRGANNKMIEKNIKLLISSTSSVLVIGLVRLSFRGARGIHGIVIEIFEDLAMKRRYG